MKRIVWILLVLLFLCSCHNAPKLSSQQTDLKGEVVSGQELTCLVETAEEALSIAQQYDIELIDFEAGVAVFHTDRDWNEVIKQGLNAGWPELSPNYVIELM